MDVFELSAKLSLDDSEYTRGLKNAEGQASSFNSGLSGLNGTFSKVGKAAKVAMGVVTGAIGAGVAAVGAFAAASVKTGMEFDSAMSQVAATMGKTTAEIQDLRDYAQEMGRTTAFSATQAAEALNYMALAGYDAETSMSMLPNVLNLAASGGMDLAAASDMVTDASSALGLSIDDTTNMVDQMAAAASSSNTSVSQLGEGMLTIGATAKSLSGGTVELSTALGILADNGLKGAEGGTKLRNVLLGIQSSKFDKTFGELGVSAYDADGNLRPLQETLSDLDKAMEGWTTEERSKALTKAFNKQDLSAVNALLGTSVDRWEELGLAIEDSAGAAEKMADTQLDNLAGDVTMFKSALEGTQIAISDALTPALREFVQFGTQGLSDITEAMNKNGLEGGIEQLGTTLSEGVDMILDKAPKFLEAGAKLVQSLAKGMANTLTKSFPKFTSAITGLIQKISKWLTRNMSKITSTVAEIISTVIKSIVENAPKVLKAVTEVVQSVIKELSKTNGIEGAIMKIVALFGALKIGAPVIGGFSSFFQSTQAGFNGILGLLTTFNSRTMAMQNTLGGVFSNLTSNVGNAMSAFQLNMVSGQNAAQALGTTLSQTLGQGFGGLTDKVNKFSSSLSVASKGLLGFGGGAVEVMGVSDAFSKLLSGTENVGGALLELGGSVGAAAASFTMAFGVPAGLVATAIAGVIGLIVGLQKHMKELADEATGEAIYNALYTPGGVSIETLSQKYVDQFNEISKEAGYLSEKLDSVGETRESVESAANSFSTLTSAVESGAYTIEEKLPEMQESFTSLKDGISTAMTETYDIITGSIAGAWADLLVAQGEDVPELIAGLAGYKEGVEENLGGLQEQFDSLVEKFNGTSDEMEKAEIGQKLLDVQQQLASLAGVDVEEPTKKIAAYGESLDISQYFDMDEFALDTEKFANSLSGMAEAGSDAVDATVENSTAMSDEIDNLRSMIEAAGLDAEDYDWDALYGANDSQRRATLSAIADAYQEQADTIQGYLVDQIPAVIENAQSNWDDMDPVAKSFYQYNEGYYLRDALEKYKSGVIDPAMGVLESNFSDALGDTGETLNTYASEAGADAIDSMFEDDYTDVLNPKFSQLTSDIQGKLDEIKSQYAPMAQPLGENMAEGIKVGIESKSGDVTSAMLTLARDAVTAAKAELVIKSPSRVMRDEVGKNIALGVAKGIKENSKHAEDSAKELGDAIVKAAKDRLDKSQTYKDWSLEAEVAYWDTIRKQVKKGSDARLEADKEYFAARQTLEDEQYEESVNNLVNHYDKVLKTARSAANAIAKVANDEDVISTAQTWLDNQSVYHDISTKYEVKYWDNIRKQFKKGTAERIEADKLYYEAKNKLADEAAEKEEKRLEKEEARLQKWQEKRLNSAIANVSAIVKNAQNGARKIIEAVSDVNDLLSAAESWLSNYQVFHDTNLKFEMDYWEAIREQIKDIFGENSQEYIDASKNYLAAKKAYDEEIANARELVSNFYTEYNKVMKDYKQQRADLEASRLEQLASIEKKEIEDLQSLEDNYRKDLQSINDQLASDIESVTNSYLSSVESRKSAIMGMTGLFSRTSYDKTYSKEFLKEALQDQVSALTDWDNQLDILSGKLGQDNPLLKELESMGVSSLYTLKEINDMSNDELKEYAELYNKKSQIAQNRAEDENRTLYNETQKQIEQLKSQAEASRVELAMQYETNRQTIIAQAAIERQTLNDEIDKDIADLEKATAETLSGLEKELNDGLAEIKETTGASSKEIGKAINQGMADGIKQSAAIVSMAAQRAAADALAAAKAALGVHSPSTKFAWVGKMVDEGFAKGISDNAKMVKDEIDNIVKLPSRVSVGDMSSVVSGSNNVGGFTQNLTVNAPQALNPSEVARQTRLANQQMVLALRTV